MASEGHPLWRVQLTPVCAAHPYDVYSAPLMTCTTHPLWRVQRTPYDVCNVPPMTCATYPLWRVQRTPYDVCNVPPMTCATYPLWRVQRTPMMCAAHPLWRVQRTPYDVCSAPLMTCAAHPYDVCRASPCSDRQWRKVRPTGVPVVEPYRGGASRGIRFRQKVIFLFVVNHVSNSQHLSVVAIITIIFRLLCVVKEVRLQCQQLFELWIRSNEDLWHAFPFELHTPAVWTIGSSLGVSGISMKSLIDKLTNKYLLSGGDFIVRGEGDWNKGQLL